MSARLPPGIIVSLVSVDIGRSIRFEVRCSNCDADWIGWYYGEVRAPMKGVEHYLVHHLPATWRYRTGFPWSYALHHYGKGL